MHFLMNKWICAVHCLVSNCIFYPKVNNDAALWMLAGISPDYIILSRSEMCSHSTPNFRFDHSLQSRRSSVEVSHPSGGVFFLFFFSFTNGWLQLHLVCCWSKAETFRIGCVLCGGGRAPVCLQRLRQLTLSGWLLPARSPAENCSSWSGRRQMARSLGGIYGFMQLIIQSTISQPVISV